MIQTSYYSTFTKKYYPTVDEARDEEKTYALAVLSDKANYKAIDSHNLSCEAVISNENELNIDVYGFMPLTIEAVEAFLILVEEPIHFRPTQFKPLTPIIFSDDSYAWELIPDLYKYVDKLAREIDDRRVAIENLANEGE